MHYFKLQKLEFKQLIDNITIKRNQKIQSLKIIDNI